MALWPLVGRGSKGMGSHALESHQAIIGSSCILYSVLFSVESVSQLAAHYWGRRNPYGINQPLSSNSALREAFFGPRAQTADGCARITVGPMGFHCSAAANSCGTLAERTDHQKVAVGFVGDGCQAHETLSQLGVHSFPGMNCETPSDREASGCAN